MGGIISFWWAASFRYDGRHHLVLVGDIARNQHASTLNGNRSRGTGILNNEMYIDVSSRNRLSYAKDPETGKRRSRRNANDAVIAV